MKTLVNNLYTNPLIALAYSVLGIATGISLHMMRVTLGMTIVAPPHELLDLVVKYFQMFAYAGGGIAGFVSGHGWVVKQKWYVKLKHKIKRK